MFWNFGFVAASPSKFARICTRLTARVYPLQTSCALRNDCTQSVCPCETRTLLPRPYVGPMFACTPASVSVPNAFSFPQTRRIHWSCRRLLRRRLGSSLPRGCAGAIVTLRSDPSLMRPPGILIGLPLDRGKCQGQDVKIRVVMVLLRRRRSL